MILGQMWSLPFGCACQSVRTTLAAWSELENVKIQAHLVTVRPLIQQVSHDTPAPAATNVKVLGVLRRVMASAECMAHFVLVAPVACAGAALLRGALQWSSKAGMASQVHRSAWPGRCASAGGGSGK